MTHRVWLPASPRLSQAADGRQTPPPVCSNESPEIHPPIEQPEPGTAPRYALAHDWIVAKRGGELVLAEIAHALAAHTTLSPTALYTMFHNGTAIDPDLDALPIRTSTLNALPASLRRWLLPAYPHAIRNLTAALAHDHAQQPIDLLISTSSVAAKAIRPPAGVPHVCYCHTPARYLWTQSDQYTHGGLKGSLRGAGLAFFRNRLQSWDRATAAHVTRFVANSTHTRDLIRHAYDRDAHVVHPPVRTDFFTPDPSVPRTDALLIVSALEPYKRVDLAIDIAAAADRPLTVIGTGSHERALRQHAAGNPKARVTFLGHADDETVRDHYRSSAMFLMPQTEDFGITAVEAQACGTPVAAFAVAGALDTVIHQQTGLLIDSEDPAEWARAIHATPPILADDCRLNAERFAPECFHASFMEALDTDPPSEPAP